MRTYNLQKLKRRVAIPDIVRTIDAVVVHHTASPQSTSFKQIYRWHTIENGWSDIGYHFVITEDGNKIIGEEASPLRNEAGFFIAVEDPFEQNVNLKDPDQLIKIEQKTTTYVYDPYWSQVLDREFGEL